MDGRDEYTPGNGREGTFDWEGVRGRIARANAAMTGLDETSPEVMGQVWARRAARYAQVPIEEEEGEQVDLLLVRLGREVYGLDAQYVSVIRPVEQITRVPRVPDWVAGVVNIRGRILSVIDLRRFFGLPAAVGDGRGGSGNGSDGSTGGSYGLDEGRRPELVEGVPSLVVVEAPEMEVALLTQDVMNIRALPAARVEDATGTVRGLRPEYVQGVAEYDDGEAAADGEGAVLVVLDLPALLADERLIIHEEIV
jgi:purine-binding chemotaxis protein CheW